MVVFPTAYDDTVHNTRVNSCCPKHLGGSSATKKIAQTPRKCCPRRGTNVTFSKLAPQKNTLACVVFWNRALRSGNYFINYWINSGQNILKRTFFLRFFFGLLTPNRDLITGLSRRWALQCNQLFGRVASALQQFTMCVGCHAVCPRVNWFWQSSLPNNQKT